MLLYPNCKINIGLRVLGKRADGYHDLQTIFYPLFDLHDELEVTISDTFSFVSEGIAVDCAIEDNLIVRTYRLMRAHYPQIGAVHIRFRKNIPFGAGLGGGSSDAAHMAIALNSLFHLGLSQEALAQEVRPLGADCPFFIYNTPCFATGIGDILTPLPSSLQGLRIVLIKPDCAVSTREAYSGLRLSDNAPCATLADWQHSLSCLAAGEASSLLFNDFETSVFPLYPKIERIKSLLLASGAFYASMSGSGSTVFGLFDAQSELTSLADLRMLEQEPSAVILLDNTLR